MKEEQARAGRVCIRGLSSLVLYSVLRGFFPGYSAFSPNQKPTFDLICCDLV